MRPAGRCGRAILWNDTRSGPRRQRLVESLGREAWATRIGSVPVPSFTVTRWAWLRENEPDVARAARAVRLPHDFLTERLTGRAVTDRSDVSGTGWWSTATGGYDPATSWASAAVELDVSLLPEVLPPDGVAGTVRDDAAAFLGIRAGIPVGPGAGDNAGAALGLGLTPGTPVISLGTSGVAYAVSAGRPVNPSGIVAGFADASGNFLPLTATLNCTLAVDRVSAWLGLDREQVAPSDGVVVLPWFDGERTPDLPDAQAAIIGLRHDTAPGAILGAVYEGAAVGLLDALDAISACSDPLPADAPLVLIGGGARRTPWRTPSAGSPGAGCGCPRIRDLVARGAAAQAAAALGGTDPIGVQSGWAVPDQWSSSRCPSTRGCSRAIGASATGSWARWATSARSRGPDASGIRSARVRHLQRERDRYRSDTSQVYVAAGRFDCARRMLGPDTDVAVLPEPSTTVSWRVGLVAFLPDDENLSADTEAPSPTVTVNLLSGLPLESSQ